MKNKIRLSGVLFIAVGSFYFWFTTGNYILNKLPQYNPETLSATHVLLSLILPLLEGMMITMAGMFVVVLDELRKKDKN